MSTNAIASRKKNAVSSGSGSAGSNPQASGARAADSGPGASGAGAPSTRTGNADAVRAGGSADSMLTGSADSMHTGSADSMLTGSADPLLTRVSTRSEGASSPIHTEFLGSVPPARAVGSATADALPAPGSLPAAEVEAKLLSALRDLDTARRNAVIWFGEILDRKLYREFGCSTIYQYTGTRLGFSRARTAYFLRLCQSFERLPALRESVASGAVPWTKAREVVKVATPRTEAFWVEQAQTTGRRELERRVAATRAAAVARRRAPGHRDLLAGGPGSAGGGAALPPGNNGTAPDARGTPPPDDPVIEVPVTVSFTLTPEQYARYEALFERARRNGHRESREELLLAALETLARVTAAEVLTRGNIGSGESHGLDAAVLTRGNIGSGESHGLDAAVLTRGNTGSGESHGLDAEVLARGNIGIEEPARPMPPAPTAPRYQIVIRQCETCGRAEIATGRGALAISSATLKAALCDARIHRPGKRNKATIPPSARMEVLARDGHRCRTAGCGNPHFLDVHHIQAREDGGTNHPDNLITLCTPCHRLIHERAASAPGSWPLRHRGP